ncbi:MAG: hypothetical protein FJ095_14700 [Deltaproteobacteria bacterium]|nr:hypothetical protein [Deltaproteobacteria bacterium]
MSLLALTLGVAVLFGGLAIFTVRREHARKSALRDLAERLGWTLDDSTPDLAWRLTRTLRGRTASIVASAPVSQHWMHHAPPRYTRCELDVGLEGALLLQARQPLMDALGALNPLRHMVGPAYEALARLPEIKEPSKLASSLSLRADREDRIRSALAAEGLDLLASWKPSADLPTPMVSLHEGNLRVTLPGAVLWSPEDVEQLVRLFEALLPPDAT